MILERKVRKAFLEKGHLRGHLNEFGGVPAKILGGDISGRDHSKCHGPGEEAQEGHHASEEQGRGRMG